MSLAGWLSGVFKAVKLLYSFSTSGPSSTLNPISEKIDEISSIVCETGWILPLTKDLSGRVISIFSFSNFSLIFFDSISFILFVIKFCNSSLIWLRSDANFFLSISDIELMFLNWDEIKPFFPNSSDLIIFISSRFRFSLSLLTNFSFIFFKSDILVDYFLKK